MSQLPSNALPRGDGETETATTTVYEEDYHSYDMYDEEDDDEGCDDRERLLRYMVPGSTVDDIVSSDEDAGTDRWSRFELMDGVKGGGPSVILDCAEREGVGGAVHDTTRSAGNGHASDGCAGCVPARTSAQVSTAYTSRCTASYGVAAAQPGSSSSRPTSTCHKSSNSTNAMRRIRLDDLHDLRPYRSSGNSAVEAAAVTAAAGSGGHSNSCSQNNSSSSNKKIDRSERATVEHVMDPRTRLILYKLVNSGILREINGCVSTGKEANVYYAVCGDGSDAAIKVFNTSILAFRDRDQYVEGEFRFQRYCKSNPRKMVSTWAEKEARNLCRLQEGGVLAPAVKLLRQHVLVMEFLGEDGWPAPRLKEVRFPSEAVLDHCYLDLCCTMRKMFNTCKLIHGDLSEYNLLLYRGRVVVIDVSQSVESDHPRAMDFLRRDIVNVNTFFKTQGHSNLFSYQDLYYFVTATSFAEKIVRSVVNDDNTISGSNQNGTTSMDGNTLASSQVATASCSDRSAVVSSNNSNTQASVKRKGKTTKAALSKSAVGRVKKPVLVEPTEELIEWLKALRVRRQAEKEGAESAVHLRQAEVDEQVFLRITVPRTLNEVGERIEPNEDIARFVHAMTVAGPSATHVPTPVVGPSRTTTTKQLGNTCTSRNKNTSNSYDYVEDKDQSEVDRSESDIDDDDAEADEECEGVADSEAPGESTSAVAQVTLANLTRDERKAHKKMIKETNRERRVQKKQNKKAGKSKAKK